MKKLYKMTKKGNKIQKEKIKKVEFLRVSKILLEEQEVHVYIHRGEMVNLVQIFFCVEETISYISSIS
jgi:hypothetical protein